MKTDQKFEAMRRDILKATLPNVFFDGWSKTALTRGAESAGYTEFDAERAFPGGPADAVALYFEENDRRMLEALDNSDFDEMRVRDKIAFAVRTRFEQADKEVVRRTVSFLMLPRHAGLAASAGCRTMDVIWRAAGDRSTDFNYYTKRTLLAAIYNSTLLYWLEDDSEDNVETWAFLDRSIDAVMQVPKYTGKVKSILAKLPDPFKIAGEFRSAWPG